VNPRDFCDTVECATFLLLEIIVRRHGPANARACRCALEFSTEIEQKKQGAMVTNPKRMRESKAAFAARVGAAARLKGNAAWGVRERKEHAARMILGNRDDDADFLICEDAFLRHGAPLEGGQQEPELEGGAGSVRLAMLREWRHMWSATRKNVRRSIRKYFVPSRSWGRRALSRNAMYVVKRDNQADFYSSPEV
jgi:hypothetical protein